MCSREYHFSIVLGEAILNQPTASQPRTPEVAQLQWQSRGDDLQRTTDAHASPAQVPDLTYLSNTNAYYDLPLTFGGYFVVLL